MVGGDSLGAVAFLSGSDVEWMGDSQRSRLRGRLRELRAAELVERTRERADVSRCAAHSSTGERLLGELVHATDIGVLLGLAATNNI
jgi:hypothetical protein